MAKTVVQVTFRPDRAKMLLPELKEHIELVESLMDAVVAAPSDVSVELNTDYDDDSRIIVTTWTV